MNCSDCGAELAGSAERGFAFGSRGMLCFECGIRRGGSYDDLHDHWVREPRIDDLGSEYE
jgi:hypothetical protein